jgi:hypothetical protein
MTGWKHLSLLLGGAAFCALTTPHAIGQPTVGPGGANVEASGPGIRPGIPVGILGVHLGQYVTIEGVRAEEGTFIGTQTLLVDTIGGKKLEKRIHIWVNNLELPAKKRCVFKGYESGQMIGTPPAEIDAAKEQGRVAGVTQAGWQWHPHFVVLIVVEPKGLEVPKEK